MVALHHEPDPAEADDAEADPAEVHPSSAAVRGRKEVAGPGKTVEGTRPCAPEARSRREEDSRPSPCPGTRPGGRHSSGEGKTAYPFAQGKRGREADLEEEIFRSSYV